MNRCFPQHGKLFGDFSTLWKKVFHGVENSSGRAFRVSRSYAPLAALAGDGARPGSAPGFAALRLSRTLRGWRARRCSRSRLRGAGFGAAGRRGAAVSPALVFPPAPPFRRRPLFMRIIGRGKTHPRSLTSFVHWGQPHGGQFSPTGRGQRPQLQKTAKPSQ